MVFVVFYLNEIISGVVAQWPYWTVNRGYGMTYLIAAIGLTRGGSSAVHYTFTHKQYTEKHNETKYLERNTCNNKNT